MSDKNITLEYYPKTVTSIILNDSLLPKFWEDVRDKDSSGTTTPQGSRRSNESNLPQPLSPFRDGSRSLDELPSLFGIIKKQGFQRKQLRVFFVRKVIESPREPNRFPERKLSVPSHVIPKKKMSPPTRVEPEDEHACAAEKVNRNRIRRPCQEWRLQCAMRREKEDVHLNQRQAQELASWRQRASSLKAKSRRYQEGRQAVKIVIIGAGLSGLSAAHQLISRKFKNVTVLEALDRIGGRIHSVTNNEDLSHVMELGAPGIHHLETWNSAFELASRNNLSNEPQCDTRSSDIHFFQHIDTSDWKKSKGKAMQYSLGLEGSKGVIKQMNRNSQKQGINMSHRDYLREQTRRLCKSMTARNFEASTVSDLTYQMSCFMQERLHRSGDSEGTAAVQHLDGSTKATSRLMRLPQGMSSLLTPLIKKFQKDTIRYNSCVTKIDLSSCYPSKTGRGIDPGIKITCENGIVYTANHVIITLPLGYLKQHARDLFHPRLSESKLKAIQKLGFGAISKIFLHYSRPFLTQPMKFIWSDDTSVDQDLCRRDTLIFTAQADDSVIEVATLGTYLEDVCDSYLKRLLTSVLTSYLRTEIPDPEKITRSFWSASAFFGGTHPFMSQGSTEEEVQELAAPILADDGTPVVLFAGDATYKNYSCLTHAARASGQREASRIERFYNELQKYKNTN